MILPKANCLTPDQVREVTEIVEAGGCRIQPIVGAVRTIYAIVGDERDELMMNRLEGLDYIDRIDRIQSPFKLMDIRSDLATPPDSIGGVTLGRQLLVIAGQCTIDPKNPHFVYETAQAVKEAGAPRAAGRGLEAAHQPLRVPGRRQVARHPDGGLAPHRAAGGHRGDGRGPAEAGPRRRRADAAGRARATP